MDRRVSVAALALLALLSSSGCQDYNFNPVGHCVIQPGSERITLSDVSTADVLFVVDDSGSMATEQASLGANFSQFLNVLISANQQRAANPPLQPIDFHLAVTSTSVFFNPTVNDPYGSACSDTCPGAIGSRVCCIENAGGQVVPQPPLCGSSTECAAGYECRSDCQGNSFVGSTACCKAAVPHEGQRIGCATVGEACGDLDQYYYYDGVCQPSYVGPASSALRTVHYPQGKFMADAGNAKVLHFTRGLNWAAGTGDPAISSLTTDFSQNVVVGTCGSPEEQGLEAAKLAVEKALAGQQAVPACPADWTPASSVDCWPHPRSKLVVVFVTDENDASSPLSASSGVVFSNLTPDNNTPADNLRKYAIGRYADYFASLGRPFGAAFIASAKLTGCTDGGASDPTCVQCADETCYAEQCLPAGGCGGAPPGTCGGQADPQRYFDFASALRANGADVVVGSICDSFGATLGRIGEIVKPPIGLTLPTQPAATDVTVLRIADSSGKTRKTCSRPAPPPATPISEPTSVNRCDPADPSNVAALAYINSIKGTYDWWFTRSADQICSWDKLPTAASRFVYINHATGNCEANPGETYSADYIGQLPPGGCHTDGDCAAALGGASTDWTCFGGYDGAHACVSTATTAGTCVCGSRAANCPGGSL